jgi:signal transduction histidine kinase
VLTLAREGDESVAPEPVHLATLAEECWETVETDCATLTCRTDRVVEADRSRLRQLLENLFANAVEHGGDAVTVTVGDLGEGGFYVADDGPGVPPDERESVFDVGYSTMTDGTGFGLNIVSQVADAHGWDVAVTESDDDGARFEFVGLDAA